MRIWLILSLGLSIDCYADPIELDKSVSPNGQFYLTINPSPDEPMTTSDMLQVRRVRNQKVLASFEWSQFGPRISSSSATSLWKPDSSAFALIWHQARGWTGSGVYAVRGSRWVEVPIPGFKTPYRGEEGWKTRSRGHFVAIAWLPNDILKLDFDNDPYRFDRSGQVVMGTGLWIYLKLLRGSSGPSLDVVSVDVMEAAGTAEK